jgi:hypothetical protein
VKAQTAPRVVLTCTVALAGALFTAGCGAAATGAKQGEQSAAQLERSEEAALKKQEVAEIAQDHEVLSAIEGKKREEAAERNARHTEAAAAARAKKKEEAAAKKVKHEEEEAEANARKREQAVKAEAKKQREAAKKHKLAAKTQVGPAAQQPSSTTESKPAASTQAQTTSAGQAHE